MKAGTLFDDSTAGPVKIGDAAALAADRMRAALDGSASNSADAFQPVGAVALATLATDPEPVTADPPPRECEHCGRSFQPRAGSGGRPQRYCSTECRQAANAKPKAPTLANEIPTAEAQELANVAMEAARAKIAELTPPGNFDWSASGEDAESVVLWEQPATAVYWNPRGQAVIRQSRWDDDDPYLIFAAENLPRLIERLEAMLKEAYERT